jgi:hypothetical protein
LEATIAADENNGISISTSFVNISSVPWVNKTTEQWILYVNDGVDDTMYRITVVYFPVNSAVSIERLIDINLNYILIFMLDISIKNYFLN